MKKFFFIALMAVLAIPAMQARQNFPTKAIAQKAQAGIRHTDQVVTPHTQFKAPVVTAEDIPEGMARVTLAAGDIWSDHSGYQMLLDADATAYGTVFAETGPLTQSGDADAAVYAAFEYKIPENADGSLSTQNVVCGSSASILIPAGVYDYVITNPSPGDRIWIASEDGTIGGRYNDFTFEAGKAYTFTVRMGDSGNDATDLTVSGGTGEPATAPTNVTANPKATTATVAWTDYDDSSWNLRYRVYNPDADPKAMVWDFEDGMGDWTSIDADGDGLSWYCYDPISAGYDPGEGVCLFGTKCATSASYAGKALTPDNWLVSPQVNLGGKLSFWAAGQDPDWPAEVFAVYVTTGDPTDVNSYEKISDDITSTSPIKQYEFDLSAYAGQQGHVAFRHYNVTDMYRLNIDNVSIGNGSAPAPWLSLNGLSETQVELQNLAQNTTYEVQVQAENSVGLSDWTESVLFTTLDEQPITAVYINGYESPVGGENSQEHLNITVPEDANYHIYRNTYSPEWYDYDADDDFFGTFVADTRYQVAMTLEANDGYYFADNCVFYVNGGQELVDKNDTHPDEDNNKFAYIWTVPEIASGGGSETKWITEVYVNGYESPVAGQDSQDHLNLTVPEDANYHIYANQWSPEWWDNDADDDFFGIFVEGTYYSVGMTIEANEGYRFATNCVFYVNGGQELVDMDYTGLDDESDTYAYVWTIPEAAQTVSGVQNKSEAKSVAGVRYYNLAGQELQKAEGVTIVVTTYTDGTTSAVKVMK